MFHVFERALHLPATDRNNRRPLHPLWLHFGCKGQCFPPFFLYLTIFFYAKFFRCNVIWQSGPDYRFFCFSYFRLIYTHTRQYCVTIRDTFPFLTSFCQNEFSFVCWEWMTNRGSKIMMLTGRRKIYTNKRHAAEKLLDTFGTVPRLLSFMLT